MTGGISGICKALQFLHYDCSLVHANVCIPSIFVDQAGDWKLGGMELVLDSSSAGPSGKP